MANGNGAVPGSPDIPEFSTQTEENATKTSHTIHQLRRPYLTSRSSPEKSSSSASVNGSTQRASTSAATARKMSWISGLASRFSSSASPSSAMTATATATTSATVAATATANTTPGELVLAAKSPNEKPIPIPQGRRASLTSATPIPSDESAPYIPASPKASQPSFLQSAFRRFQSSSSQLPAMGNVGSGGGLCERRVMNVDKSRERIRIEGLEQSKLRRVAFCVDVEIAGMPKYADQEDEDRSRKRRRSKGKDQKLKEKGEPKVTKPSGRAKFEGNDGAVNIADESIEKSESEMWAIRRKKPELGQGEQNVDIQGQAAANGIHHTGNRESKTGSRGTPPPEARNHKPHDQPTTDPLRIYRRCCQLRETTPLTKVVEQLIAPKAAIAIPGTVTCLDLCDLWMPLADAITFADWLAVVPVRKLKVENCGLGDEAVRVILGGLLAAKSNFTENPRRSSRQPNIEGDSPDQDGKMLFSEKRGYIEKLSLKNNPKISREGWKHITLFLHLSRSIKAIDLSMIPFPKLLSATSGLGSLLRSGPEKFFAWDMASLLADAISKRYAGSHLEELIMSGCQLAPEDVARIVKGISISGLRRLGLANNQLTAEGLQHVAEYLRHGICEGLDLGGNDLQDGLSIIADALGDKNPMYALSLANCNLVPSSLTPLLPALVSLPSFRFIDLSQNRNLFSTQPNALGLLRKYLPRMRKLKRIHLEDVALSSEHAIALMEIIPEISQLAHVSFLENAPLTRIALAGDEASQEEACALYASLMTAVRVSESIICVDVDVPGPDSSEVVKALAKQVVAYCLRNMERGPVAEYDSAREGPSTGSLGADKGPVVQNALLHLVGTTDRIQEDYNSDDPTPDADYVIGGTGVVKALGICLGNTSTEFRRGLTDGGTTRPLSSVHDEEIGKGKAKEMSKSLLDSARKIRARLQPALVKEAKSDDELGYRRLLFLDQTLQRMIQRFEDEYPECRLEPATSLTEPSANVVSSADSKGLAVTEDVDHNHSSFTNLADPMLVPVSGGEDEGMTVHARPSRHGSEVSLASRVLSREEGRMHRIGHQVRMDIFRTPSSSSPASGAMHTSVHTATLSSSSRSAEVFSEMATTTAAAAAASTDTQRPAPIEISAEERASLDEVQRRISDVGGMELGKRMMCDGPEVTLRDIGVTMDELQRLAMLEPEFYNVFHQAQDLAQKNQALVDMADSPTEEEEEPVVGLLARPGTESWANSAIIEPTTFSPSSSSSDMDLPPPRLIPASSLPVKHEKGERVVSVPMPESTIGT